MLRLEHTGSGEWESGFELSSDDPVDRFIAGIWVIALADARKRGDQRTDQLYGDMGAATLSNFMWFRQVRVDMVVAEPDIAEDRGSPARLFVPDRHVDILGILLECSSHSVTVCPPAAVGLAEETRLRVHDEPGSIAA